MKVAKVPNQLIEINFVVAFVEWVVGR